MLEERGMRAVDREGRVIGYLTPEAQQMVRNLDSEMAEARIISADNSRALQIGIYAEDGVAEEEPRDPDGLKPRNPDNCSHWFDLDKPPLSSWTHTNSFYDGTRIITEFYDWNADGSDRIGEIPGFTSDDVARLTITYVERHTGEVVDIHHHSFIGGQTLENVRRDFKVKFMPCWSVARKLVSSFPARTMIDFNRTLDPFIDYQSKYFLLTDYAEVMGSRLKSVDYVVRFVEATPKSNARVRLDLHYTKEGIAGCDCIIERRTKKYRLRMRKSKRDVFIKRIDEYESTDSYHGRWAIRFSSTCSSDYHKQLICRGIESPAPPSNRFEKPGKARKAKAGMTSSRAHRWTKEDDSALLANSGMTARELAQMIGVTPKTIERRRAKLRAINGGCHFR